MNRIFFLILILLAFAAFIQTATFANVATSDSYGMTLGILDVGGGTSESTNYSA